MNITPEEMRDINNHVQRVESLSTKLSTAAMDLDAEVDILKRRLSFINHPAGRALNAEQLKEKQKLRESPNQPGSYFAEVLNFPKKEN